jgi:hypothetical protein
MLPTLCLLLYFCQPHDLAYINQHKTAVLNESYQQTPRSQQLEFDVKESVHGASVRGCSIAEFWESGHFHSFAVCKSAKLVVTSNEHDEANRSHELS